MNRQCPALRTLRLFLRPFVPEDASTVQQLASDPAMARGTLAIPPPCPDRWAETWITAHKEQFERGKAVYFALECQDNHALIGTVYLHLELSHARGELGYWIGKPFWGQGYATEAAKAIVGYGFGEWKLFV